MNSSSCSVINQGTWNAITTTVNKGAFLNEGSFSTGNLTVNSNGTFVGDGTLFIAFGDVKVNGTLNMHQPTTINGNLKVNGGGDASFLESLNVLGNIVNNNNLDLWANTSVSGNVVNNGGGDLSIDGGILSVSGNFTNHGNATGSSDDCGGVSVFGSSINTGSYGQGGGTLDICDNGSGFDLQYGTVGPGVSNCSCTPGTPLPIELLDFNAQPIAGGVELKWNTATEIDNHFFTIERTEDGSVIETVGTINGSGNSNRPLSYSLVDDVTVTNTVYYRLRQTDFNGTVTTFEWQAVQAASVETEEPIYQVGPNPVNNGQVWLGCENCDGQETTTVELFNLQGQSVAIFPTLSLNSMQSEQLTIGNELPSGYYFLKVNTGSHTMMQKLVVE